MAGQKSHIAVVRSTVRSQTVKNASGSEHFWESKCGKYACCCRISRPQCVKHSKGMAGVGPLKRSGKEALHVAGAGEETSLSKMLGGQGADFLTRAAFWSPCILHPCTHAPTHPCTHPGAHAPMYTYKHTGTQIQTDTNIHTYIYTNTHAHTHTDIET